MFVGVSQSLPKTSSIKMVDYWLVFNLLIPFIEVLIHTYEDTLRTDEQEVNHHGRTVTVGGDKDKKDVKIAFSDSKFKDASGNDYDKKLFSVNEEVQVCLSLDLINKLDWGSIRSSSRNGIGAILAFLELLSESEPKRYHAKCHLS